MDTHTNRSAFAQAYIAHLLAEREAKRQRRYRAFPTYSQTIEAMKAERAVH